MSILFCFGVCHKDSALALKTAERMAEIMPKCEDPCLFSVTPNAQALPEIPKIQAALERVFEKVEFYKLRTEHAKSSPWLPQNYMFASVLTKVHYDYKDKVSAFFFMEPDCYPVQGDWWEVLKSQYAAGGKPFMGVKRDTRLTVNGKTKIIGNHLNGVAFYPSDLMRMVPGIATPHPKQPWDAMYGRSIFYRASTTNKIWIDINHASWTKEEFEKVPQEVVLIHGNKDGSLFNLKDEDQGGLDSPPQNQQEPQAGSQTEKPSKPAGLVPLANIDRTPPAATLETSTQNAPQAPRIRGRRARMRPGWKPA